MFDCMLFERPYRSYLGPGSCHLKGLTWLDKGLITEEVEEEAVGSRGREGVAQSGWITQGKVMSLWLATDNLNLILILFCEAKLSHVGQNL